jgi:hypothetical protein
MPAARTRDQGKTSFVKEVLNDNPQANSKAVNLAWTEAGMEGTISDTLVNKMRSQLGLAGNLRGKRRTRKGSGATGTRPYTGKKRGRKPKSAFVTQVSDADGITTMTGRRKGRLADIEAELDVLLFKVMNLGGLTEIENALRETRRRLYASLYTKPS